VSYDQSKGNCSTYISSRGASDECRSCFEGRRNASTGRKTTRNLHVYSGQKHCSSNTMSEPAVEVGKHTNSEGSKCVSNGRGGCELHISKEVDSVARRGNDDHGRHLLELGLHRESDEENVKWDEEEVPVLVQRGGAGLCIGSIGVNGTVNGCANSNAVAKEE
jgi:hypothetical protein